MFYSVYKLIIGQVFVCAAASVREEDSEVNDEEKERIRKKTESSLWLAVIANIQRIFFTLRIYFQSLY